MALPPSSLLFSTSQSHQVSHSSRANARTIKALKPPSLGDTYPQQNRCISAGLCSASGPPLLINHGPAGAIHTCRTFVRFPRSYTVPGLTEEAAAVGGAAKSLSLSLSTPKGSITQFSKFADHLLFLTITSTHIAPCCRYSQAPHYSPHTMTHVLLAAQYSAQQTSAHTYSLTHVTAVQVSAALPQGLGIIP